MYSTISVILGLKHFFLESILALIHISSCLDQCTLPFYFTVYLLNVLLVLLWVKVIYSI